MFCRNCGAAADRGAKFCARCGASLLLPEGEEPAPTPMPPAPPAGWGENPEAPIGATSAADAGQFASSPPLPGALPPLQKHKLTAAILGFLVGWLGVHRFYLGYTSIGIVQAVLGVAGIFTCGVSTLAAWIWGIVDGVMILTGSLRTDAQGIPLRD